MTPNSSTELKFTAEYWIKKLQLIPHPEGGFYKETFQSNHQLDDERQYTTIFYLLKEGQFSAFHRLGSDEIWHHYHGGELEISMLGMEGPKTETLGIGENANPQILVPAETWFTAAPVSGVDFVLCGCTMSPGFSMEQFEFGVFADLVLQFPDLELFLKARCIR